MVRSWLGKRHARPNPSTVLALELCVAGCAGAGGCHGPRIAPFPTDVEWRLFTTVGGAETRTTYLTGADGTSKDSSVTTGSSAIAEPSTNCSNSGSLDPISKGGHLSTAQMATSSKSGRSPKSSTAAVAEGEFEHLVGDSTCRGRCQGFASGTDSIGEIHTDGSRWFLHPVQVGAEIKRERGASAITGLFFCSYRSPAGFYSR